MVCDRKCVYPVKYFLFHIDSHTYYIWYCYRDILIINNLYSQYTDMMSGKDFLKSHVLSWRRKVHSDWEVVTSSAEHSTATDG